MHSAFQTVVKVCPCYARQFAHKSSEFIGLKTSGPFRYGGFSCDTSRKKPDCSQHTYIQKFSYHLHQNRPLGPNHPCRIRIAEQHLIVRLA